MKVIHVSNLIDKFSIGIDKERKTKIVDEEKLSDYLVHLDDVIIDTHLPVKVDARCFVLRCDISELKRRLKRRGWNKEKIDENVQAEIFNECYDDMTKKGYEVVDGRCSCN